MADSRTINLNGVGPVRLERSRRAKRLVVTVRPPGVVRMAVPHRVSFTAAETFAKSRREWIIKHLNRIRHYEEVRDSRRKSEKEIDREQARATLSCRLHQLADQHGFSFNRVFIRNQRTRWGSCSHRNNISLNVRLVTLPPELLDYVILHELVHTRIKNHGREFWSELDRYVGNARLMAAKLRKIWLAVP